MGIVKTNKIELKNLKVIRIIPKSEVFKANMRINKSMRNVILEYEKNQRIARKESESIHINT